MPGGRDHLGQMKPPVQLNGTQNQRTDENNEKARTQRCEQGPYRFRAGSHSIEERYPSGLQAHFHTDIPLITANPKYRLMQSVSSQLQFVVFPAERIHSSDDR